MRPSLLRERGFARPRSTAPPAAPPSARGSCAPSSVPLGWITTAPAWPIVSEVSLRQHLDVVAGGHQPVDQMAVEARFHPQVGHRRAPGAAQQPARRVDRLVERHAVQHVPREDHGLALRLAVAAHRAVGHDAAVVEHGERRIERVERQPAGRERIQRLRIEREGRAAVLHQHAGLGQHAARAELPIERLDVGHREPGGVGRAHPDGVAFASRAPAISPPCGHRS